MTSDPTQDGRPAGQPAPQYPYAPGSTDVKPRRVAHTLGVGVAAILAFMGLFAFMFIVVFALTISSYGSNK